MTTSTTLSDADHVVPAVGRWAAGLAMFAFVLHLFAITSRIPTLTIGGLIGSILLAALVFFLSLKTYVDIKGTPYRVLRTVYLLLTMTAVVGGLLMVKELLLVLAPTIQ